MVSLRAWKCLEDFPKPNGDGEGSSSSLRVLRDTVTSHGQPIASQVQTLLSRLRRFKSSVCHPSLPFMLAIFTFHFETVGSMSTEILTHGFLPSCFLRMFLIRSMDLSGARLT